MRTGAGALFGKSPIDTGLNAWSAGGGGAAPGGSNQWMNYPAMPNFNPTQTGLYGPMTTPSASAPTRTTPGGSPYIGHGYYEAPTYDPAFTGQFYQMIQRLMGGGGGQLQNQLLSFLGGGPTTIPGAGSLAAMAQTGQPISALPEWQAMTAAQQQNIAQQQANLKEQFAFAGDLASSPFGTAMSNYMQQTALGQNALLAQLEQQAMEAAQQRKLAASQDIMGMAGAETQFLDQLFQTGAFASPQLTKKSSSSILGGIGSLLGPALGIGGSIAEGLSGGGGFMDVLSSLAGMAL